MVYGMNYFVNVMFHNQRNAKARVQVHNHVEHLEGERVNQVEQIIVLRHD